MRDIALMGRAGAGKDTAAALLAERDGYARVAFADPLREMALAVDPIVWGHRGHVYRLSYLVEQEGWDAAKRDYPEVRRVLQRLGLEGVREVIGCDTWITLAMRKVSDAHRAGRPVVVTDVRFGNELATLQLMGFVAVWIDRPGVTDGAHASEAELSRTDADTVVLNDGTPEELYARLTWPRDGGA